MKAAFMSCAGGKGGPSTTIDDGKDNSAMRCSSGLGTSPAKQEDEAPASLAF